MAEMKESKALREVREWKAAVWQEVAHLPLADAIPKLRKDSAKTCERLGFQVPQRDEKPAAMVAEPKTK